MIHDQVNNDLLCRLYEVYPGCIWLDSDRNRDDVEKLIEIGFVKRSREGVIITAAGFAYYLATEQIKESAESKLQGNTDSESCYQQQLTIWK